MKSTDKNVSVDSGLSSVSNVERLQQQVFGLYELVTNNDVIIEDLKAKIHKIGQDLKSHKISKSEYTQIKKNYEAQKKAAKAQKKVAEKQIKELKKSIRDLVKLKVKNIASRDGLNRDVKEVVVGVNKILDVIRTESIWKAMSGKVRDLGFRITGDSLRTRVTNELIDKQLEGIKTAISTSVDDAGWKKIEKSIRSQIWDYNDIIALARDKEWSSTKLTEYIASKVKKELKLDLNPEELRRLESVLTPKTLNPNAILRNSQTVRNILSSPELWETISATKPKILDLIAENRALIEREIKIVLIKEGIIPDDLGLSSKVKDKSNKITPDTIIATAKLLISNSKFIDTAIEVFSGPAKQEIIAFVSQSAALATAAEVVGIDLSEIQDEISGTIDLVASLAPLVRKFLPLLELVDLKNPPSPDQILPVVTVILKDKGVTSWLEGTLRPDSPIMKIVEKASKENPKVLEVLDSVGLQPGAITHIITLASSLGSGVFSNADKFAEVVTENQKLFESLLSGEKLQITDFMPVVESIISKPEILSIFQNILSGGSKDAIINLVTSNAKLQELSKQNGIDLSEIQDEISDAIDLVATLVPQVPKFLPLVGFAETLSQGPDKHHHDLTQEEIDEEIQNSQKLAGQVLDFAIERLQDDQLMTWFQGMSNPQSPFVQITNKVLTANPQVLGALDMVGLSSDEVTPIVTMASAMSFKILENAPGIAEVLDENKELYQDILSTVITERKYGLTELLKLDFGQVSQITNDILEITRRVSPKGLIEDQTDNLVSVAGKAVQFQLQNNMAVRAMLQNNGFDAGKVNSLIQDFLPIALDFSLIAMDDANLQTIHEDIVQKCLIMASPDIDDKTKVDTLMEVIDTGFELLSQGNVKDVYNDKLVSFLETHEETIVKAIEYGIQRSPIGEKIKIDGAQLVNLASNPAALKQVHDIYNEWKNGMPVLKYMKAAYMTLAGPKELRTVVLSAIYSAITNVVFHEFVAPNFVRRYYSGQEMNDIIKHGMENAQDGQRKDLEAIFKNALPSNIQEAIHEDKIYSLITLYSLKNNFCDGLIFDDINFTNTNINSFSFKGTTFSAENNGEVSFANCVIKDTDFSGAFFTHDIDLSNVIIDKKSFISMLPSLYEAQKNGIQIKTDGLQLDKLDLTPEERDQINKYGFGRDNLQAMEENKMLSILLETAQKYFAENDIQLQDGQVNQLEANLKCVTEIADKEHLFKRISHKDIFDNFLKKFESKDAAGNALLQGTMDKSALEAQVNSSIKTAGFHKEFRQQEQSIAMTAPCA